MENRIRAYLREPDRPKPSLDYYVVSTLDESYLVTPRTAESVLARLESRWPARWIAFTTLTGSKVRLRSALIESVFESTSAQRAAAREFRRARDAEEKADRHPWEDE